MSNDQRDVTKEQLWRESLARQASSGLSVRAFCRQEQLAESAFYAWRRTIRERDGQAPPAKTASAFVPAVVTREAAREASITLELTGGRVLRLPEATSVEKLADLVAALETRGGR